MYAPHFAAALAIKARTRPCGRCLSEPLFPTCCGWCLPRSALSPPKPQIFLTTSLTLWSLS